MSNFRKYLEAEAISGVFQIKWEVVYGMGSQQSIFFWYYLLSYEQLSYFLRLVVSKLPSYCSVSNALHSIY